MPKLTLEIDLDLYRLLQQAARSNATSLAEEGKRRLEGVSRHSIHIEPFLAELQAGSEQQERGKS